MTKQRRKPTHKKIKGKKIVTNPVFTEDKDTLIPSNLWDQLDYVIESIFRAGIAIGRARATASGSQRKR